MEVKPVKVVLELQVKVRISLVDALKLAILPGSVKDKLAKMKKDIIHREVYKGRKSRRAA